jgi:protein gp37
MTAKWLGSKLLDYFSPKPPHNVWIGTTVEDQKRADERIPDLIEIPAVKRFLSCEPLLEPLDLSYWLTESLTPQIDWVICGGESGPDARPMHPDWARRLRDQCVSVGVPFFFKQWGAWLHADGTMNRVGKKSAGRLLDGREWSQFPAH